MEQASFSVQNVTATVERGPDPTRPWNQYLSSVPERDHGSDAQVEPRVGGTLREWAAAAFHSHSKLEGGLVD